MTCSNTAVTGPVKPANGLKDPRRRVEPLCLHEGPNCVSAPNFEW